MSRRTLAVSAAYVALGCVFVALMHRHAPGNTALAALIWFWPAVLVRLRNQRRPRRHECGGRAALVRQRAEAAALGDCSKVTECNVEIRNHADRPEVTE
ncbi:hypothetical protein QCN29_13015 [Streptomyces sp. HNM0663]|uniref:Uncharacterized protein n=1 Tax=Streptomyces chengmaiensis TaxID=3040919 RepID=A0ABT6HLT9_9ACTN|nr:hypothetical protein [Streptomyces chengmaiensis]MDH2389699.1 hypothetical protein [Streptomyces chengmaiensis]